MNWRSDSGLSGKSVVVTGAAGGIGSEVAIAFSQAGAKVLAVDIPGAPLSQLLTKFKGSGHEIMEADLSDLSLHASIFAKAQSMAPFAALAHCAAVLRRRATVDDVTEEDWDIQIDINLKATFFLNRSAYHSFRSAKTPGSIVNFSSQGWQSGGFGAGCLYTTTHCRWAFSYTFLPKTFHCKELSLTFSPFYFYGSRLGSYLLCNFAWESCCSAKYYFNSSFMDFTI